MASKDDWYWRLGANVLGPLTGAQLKELVRQGRLLPEHRVARQPDGPWTPAVRVQGLFPQAPARDEGLPGERRSASKAWENPVDELSESPAASEDAPCENGPIHLRTPVGSATRRRRERKRLIAASVVAMGVAVVLGGTLLVFNPFGPGTASTDRAGGDRRAAERTDDTVADEGDLAGADSIDDLGLFPEDDASAPVTSPKTERDETALGGAAVAPTGRAQDDDQVDASVTVSAAPSPNAPVADDDHEADGEADNDETADTGDEVYELRLIEKSIDRALGGDAQQNTSSENEETLSSRERLRRDFPSLFDD